MRGWRIMAVAIGAAGVALRLHGLGRWGFSNDEAWVALMTRLTDPAQRALALGPSPIGWAGLVRLSHLLPLPPETALRLVPAIAGCLCLWAAYRGGARFAAHPLGGLAAMAVLAFDPMSVGYAKFLKQYTTETLLCLVALECAGTWADGGRPRDLAILAGVLCLGLPFSQAHLLLGPPLLGALVVLALARGEPRRAALVALAAALVGAVGALYYRIWIEPHLVQGLDRYWARQTYLPLSDPQRILELLGQRARIDLGRLLGPVLVWPGLAALGGLALTSRRRAAVGLGLALLVLELTALSMANRVPVNQPRVLLFAHASIAAYAAAALATLALTIRRAAPAAGWLACVALVAAWAVPHPWRAVGPPAGVEEVRSLVRVIERHRRPTDLVLVHQRALFAFAYYQRRLGRLYRANTGAGFLPGLADPRARVVTPATLGDRTRAALRDAPRVWFVDSRMRPAAVASLRRVLQAAGRIALERRAPNAFVFLVVRRPAAPDGASARPHDEREAVHGLDDDDRARAGVGGAGREPRAPALRAHSHPALGRERLLHDRLAPDHRLRRPS